MSGERSQAVTVEDAQMRAAVDPAFRERLIADPAAALAEAGVALPAEGSAAANLVVPPLLDLEGELPDDALAGVQGGQMGPPLWQLTRGPSPWDAS